MTYNSPAGAAVEFPATNVFDAVSANATWTDLDLSAVVGATTALVLLHLIGNDATGRALRFRAKGEAQTTYGCSTTFTSQIDNGNGAYFVVVTNSAGVIQYFSTASTWNGKMDVMAYAV